MKHVKAVIFDWAGTVVDYGSLAPMGAFVETFAEFGVAITSTRRGGQWAWRSDRTSRPWLRRRGSPKPGSRDTGIAPTEKDIDALYDVFVPKNISVAADYADVIPGVAEVVRALRAEGVKIGSSTGYTREIMARITPRAAEQGFAPDSLVCTGDTAEGRPSPLMFYKGLIDLDVWPAWSAIKVDDTTVGVAEGVNAGAWAVGVAVSGNCFNAGRGAVGISLHRVCAAAVRRTDLQQHSELDWQPLFEQQRHGWTTAAQFRGVSGACRQRAGEYRPE